MVVKDRFAELQNVPGSKVQANNNEDTPGNSKTGFRNTAFSDNGIDDQFFDEIERLKGQVDELNEKISDLRIKHNSIINPTLEADEAQLRNSVDEANATIQGLASRTNGGLKKMKIKLDQAKEKLNDGPNNNESQAMLRAQQNHYNALTRRFKSVMEDYSKAQLDYKEKLKTRLKKQLLIVDQDRKFNEEELDHMIESGNMQVFDEGFIKVQENKAILDELEIRKNEMLNLEKAITELHALFVEMANLVDEQGEMVNRILDNVANTEAYVEKAVEDVHQAARYQQGARRKKLWVVILCLIIMAVVAFIIFLSIPRG